MVAVIQVTDEDAARASLESVVDDSQIAFDSGYVFSPLIKQTSANFVGNTKPMVGSRCPRECETVAAL